MQEQSTILSRLSRDQLYSIYQFLILELKSPDEIHRQSSKEEMIASLAKVLDPPSAKYSVEFFEHYDYYTVPVLTKEMIDALPDDLLAALFSIYLDEGEQPSSHDELVARLDESPYFLKEDARKFYLWYHFFRKRLTIDDAIELEKQKFLERQEELDASKTTVLPGFSVDYDYFTNQNAAWDDEQSSPSAEQDSYTPSAEQDSYSSHDSFQETELSSTEEQITSQIEAQQISPHLSSNYLENVASLPSDQSEVADLHSTMYEIPPFSSENSSVRTSENFPSNLHISQQATSEELPRIQTQKYTAFTSGEDAALVENLESTVNFSSSFSENLPFSTQEVPPPDFQRKTFDLPSFEGEILASDSLVEENEPVDPQSTLSVTSDNLPEVEVTAEPEVEVTAEPEVEVTAEPEVEVTVEPEVEVTVEPEVEVTVEPEVEVTTTKEHSGLPREIEIDIDIEHEEEKEDDESHDEEKEEIGKTTEKETPSISIHAQNDVPSTMRTIEISALNFNEFVLENLPSTLSEEEVKAKLNELSSDTTSSSEPSIQKQEKQLSPEQSSTQKISSPEKRSNSLDLKEDLEEIEEIEELEELEEIEEIEELEELEEVSKTDLRPSSIPKKEAKTPPPPPRSEGKEAKTPPPPPASDAKETKTPPPPPRTDKMKTPPPPPRSDKAKMPPPPPSKKRQVPPPPQKNLHFTARLTPAHVDTLTAFLYKTALLGATYARPQIRTIRVFFQHVMECTPPQLRRVRNQLKKLQAQDVPLVPPSFDGFESFKTLLPYSVRISLIHNAIYLLGCKSLQNLERYRDFLNELSVALRIDPIDVNFFDLFGIGTEEIQLSFKDCLQILEVDEDAKEPEIRKAYLKKVRNFHPDQFHSKGPEFVRLAERKMKEANMALEILLHRSKHDF